MWWFLRKTIDHKIVSDEDMKERIIDRQNTRLKDFDLAKLKIQFIKLIQKLEENSNDEFQKKSFI